MGEREDALEQIKRSKRKMQTLRHLVRTGGDYNQRMAKKFDVSPGSFFNHMQRLSKYGLVTRNKEKDNDRDVYYRITDEGKKLLGAVEEPKEEAKEQ